MVDLIIGKLIELVLSHILQDSRHHHYFIAGHSRWIPTSPHLTARYRCEAIYWQAMRIGAQW